MFSFDPWRRLVLNLNLNFKFPTILLLLKLLPPPKSDTLSFIYILLFPVAISFLRACCSLLPVYYELHVLMGSSQIWVEFPFLCNSVFLTAVPGRVHTGEVTSCYLHKDSSSLSSFGFISPPHMISR